MNLIKTDFKSAVLETAKEIKQTKPYKFCLTGGNFGSFLLSELINRNYSPHKKNIFITDERLNCSKDYQNAESVLIGLRKLKNFQPFNFIPFLQINLFFFNHKLRPYITNALLRDIDQLVMRGL